MSDSSPEICGMCRCSFYPTKKVTTVGGVTVDVCEECWPLHVEPLTSALADAQQAGAAQKSLADFRLQMLRWAQSEHADLMSRLMVFFATSSLDETQLGRALRLLGVSEAHWRDFAGTNTEHRPL